MYLIPEALVYELLQKHPRNKKKTNFLIREISGLPLSLRCFIVFFFLGGGGVVSK